jgi:RHS repeat-associated protein
VPAGTKFTEVTAIDALGRTTGVKLQDLTTASTEFSDTVTTPSGFNKTFVTVTDQAGKKRRQVMDSLGRIVRADEPDTNGSLGADNATLPLQQTSYTYDGNDNLSTVIQTDNTLTPPVTQERKFKYDSLSRLTHEKQVEASSTLDDSGVHGPANPSKWTKYLKYYPDGLLDYGVDARGVRTTFDYDGLNRVSAVTYTGETGFQTPTVTYTYDQARTGFYNNGALTKVDTAATTTNPAISTEFDYDLMGRLVKHRQTIDTQQYNLEYGYNLAGQLTSEKYPSGKIVTNGYDANGRMATVADPTRTYLSALQYLGKGNAVSQMTLGNGNTETFTLNDRLQMTQQQLKKGTEVLQRYDYGYGEIDGTGNLVTTKNNGQLGRIESYIGTAKQSTQKFLYDHIGRLKESAEYRGDNNNLTYKQKFDFDRFGNLYRKAASNPTTGQQNPLLYTPIEDAHISKSTNRFNSNTTYDDAGNVTTDNKFRQMGFAYDANGRQIKATRASVPDAWTVYDASGNRVATKINDVWQYMVYDAFGKLVAEYGIQSEGMGGVKYVQQDWQGSVRTVANNNGFVVGRTDHQAFGNDVGYGVGQRSVEQGYSVGKVARQGYGLTERDDATGLDHTWFRKNENQAGRWTSPDPYNGSMNLGDPQSFNRYSYVGNEPTNFVDPSGLLVCYIDGFQANCGTAFHLVQSGGGHVSWHSVDCLTVVNEYTLIDDRRTRTGQYLHFNPLYNFNPEGNLGPRGGGGGNKNNSEDDFSDCRDEVRAEFMSDIFAASDKFNKANSDHILDPAS